MTSTNPSPTIDECRATIDGLSRFDYPKAAALPFEADMVMKGGITSGVVYPLAVCELAKQYRFRNLGGSSAGGIAAAFAAAAEYARDTGGFQRLAKLPLTLGTNLEELFKPSPGTKPVFNLLKAAIDKKHSGLVKKALIAATAVRAQWAWALAAAVAVTALLAWGVILGSGVPHHAGDWVDIARGFIVLWPIVLIALLIGALIGTVLATLRELPRNGFGLCIGSDGGTPPKTKDKVAPFTDWMNAQLNEVAGLTGDDAVLTLGHLWGEAAVKQYRAQPLNGPGQRVVAMNAADPAIRLEMMTTNVTHCRPVRLPFATDIYSWCPVELARWFPPSVLTALGTTPSLWQCPEHDVALRKLPDAPDLPVTFAIRLTLSFPGLISPVPLYAVDYSDVDNVHPVRCWFSDGGITSNFPIHFFDSLWPRRPTFGITLDPVKGDAAPTVYYPENPQSARVPRVRETSSLGQFVGALKDSMQNWADEGQAMLPGYRDRIIDIQHTKDEGGMNLTMPEETILRLACRGALAGRTLGDRFDFKAHREVRYRTAMSELQETVTGMNDRYDAALPSAAPTYQKFVTQLGTTFVRRTETLLTFAGRGKTGTPVPDFNRKAPKPDPDLRITPHF